MNHDRTMSTGHAEFGVSTFCASCHANEQCGSNGLPLTPNSIRILGRFQRLKTIEHPQLCAYLDLVRAKHERVIVASEHYNENLHDKILSGTVNSSAEYIVELAYNVLQGLSHLNGFGLVHRCLSPQCILFDSQGNVKLSNYGFYHMTGHASDVSFPIGVPKYLAPEVLCCRTHIGSPMFDSESHTIENCESSLALASSAKSDVWSLGIILLEVLMGTFVWEKLSLRQIFFKIFSFLQSDVHPFDSIVREKQMHIQIEAFPADVLSLLRLCLTVSHSSRPLPSELLQLNLFSKFKSQVSLSHNSLQMFSSEARCLNLELKIYDDASYCVDQDDDWSDLLSQRHISEIYYLWKLAGGDLESSLRKAGQIHQQPSILKLPQLIADDGECFGESRDSSSLFDDTVVMLSQDQLRQRLKDIEPSAYYPLLENETSTAELTSAHLTQSHSSVDLLECSKLPIVIREKDIEYQFHRVILFERLLKAYPYKRQQILKEARIDVPPIFRPQIWAAVLEVEGDVEGFYEAIDKESPTPTDRQIEVDIPRCHQYNELLSSPTGHVKFKRILKAWVVSHPQYVYWQGLDSLCAPFLYLNFNNEAVAYACLAAFIPKYLHNVFLKDNACIIQEYLTVFSHLIAFHDPQLSNHLEEIGFIPDLYAIPWFLTMYAHVFPLHKIFHLWDTLLLGNSSFPLCIGVAILQQLRDQLLTFGFNECILMFSDMPEIDIEKCVQESVRIFCSTPKSTTYRQYARVQKVTDRESKLVHSYYTRDYHDMPKNELSMEPVPLEELKSEKFSRISAEDLIELRELTGPTPGPSPTKRNKSAKPVIVIVDVRSEDEFKRGAVPHSINIPFHSAFGPEGDLLPSPNVQVLNQHRSQIKVVVGGSRGRHASHFAESLIQLGYSKVCVLHKGIDVLRSARLLTIPTPDL